MTSYCKSFIGFHLKITENLSFFGNKHGVLNRKMTSSRETGGAAGVHIIFCEHNRSLIKIKKMFEHTKS